MKMKKKLTRNGIALQPCCLWGHGRRHVAFCPSLTARAGAARRVFTTDAGCAVGGKKQCPRTVPKAAANAEGWVAQLSEAGEAK
jgi:hypothetical protein